MFITRFCEVYISILVMDSVSEYTGALSFLFVIFVYK